MVEKKESIDKLASVIAGLDEEKALELTRQMITDGINPLKILKSAHQGMIEIGRRYEEGIYFISGLVMAGEIMQQISQIVLPLTNGSVFGQTAGRVVLGTVEGDIHFIGKDIFKAFMRGHGFAVHDLGVDVPKNKFLSAIHEFEPEIVGISCLISTCLNSLQETLSYLKENTPADLAPRVYLAGGRLMSKRVCKTVGADLCVTDSMQGVRLCQQVMEG